MAVSAKRTHEFHDVYSDAFTGVGCFKGTFSLQVIKDAKLYHAPPSHVSLWTTRKIERF